MRTAIVGDAAEPKMATLVVWLPMLPADDEAAAHQAARLFDDPSVRQFYDPTRQAGNVVARSLGAAGQVAWDIYLFYAAGSEWTDRPPGPVDWLHQLAGRRWADAGRYRSGPGLEAQLRDSKHRLLTAW